MAKSNTRSNGADSTSTPEPRSKWQEPLKEGTGLAIADAAKLLKPHLAEATIKLLKEFLATYPDAVATLDELVMVGMARTAALEQAKVKRAQAAAGAIIRKMKDLGMSPEQIMAELAGE